MHSKHFEKVQKTWFDNTYEGEMLLYVKKTILVIREKM